MRLVLFFFLLSFSLFTKSQNIENFYSTDGLVSDFITCIDTDNSGNIWIGTNNGVSYFDGISFTNYNVSDGIIDNNILSIKCGINNEVYVGTNFGLSVYNGSNWLSYDMLSGISDNKIVNIDINQSGDVWCSHANFSSGVSVFDGTSWSVINPGNFILSCDFDDLENAWFASLLDGVIVESANNNFLNINTNNSNLISNGITDILIDQYNRKWVGTNSGLSVFDNNNNFIENHTIMYSLPPPDTLNPVVEIDIDSWNRIWVTIYVGYLAEGGVAFYNGSIWQDFDISDGVAGPNVTCLKVDYNNNVWVGTSTGLSKITPLPSNSLIFEQNKKHKVFPNPAKDYAIIYSSTNQKLYITDMYGKKVSSQIEEFSSHYEINTKSLSAGIYFINLVENNQRTVHRLIVD